MKFEFAIMSPKSLNSFDSHSFFRSYFAVEGDLLGRGPPQTSSL